MTDFIAPIATALSLATRLREIGANIRDAEFKNLLADLNLQLADAKLKMSALVEENRLLNERVRDLERADGDPCPRCRQRTWNLINSEPDPVFGAHGALRRSYQCSACGFAEKKLVDSLSER